MNAGLVATETRLEKLRFEDVRSRDRSVPVRSHFVFVLLLCVFVEFFFRVERLTTEVTLVFVCHGYGSRQLTVNNIILHLGPHDCQIGVFHDHGVEAEAHMSDFDYIVVGGRP